MIQLAKRVMAICGVDESTCRLTSHHYEAVGREFGVIVYRCGHKHQRPDLAFRCGCDYFISLRPKTIDPRWYGGGVCCFDDVTDRQIPDQDENLHRHNADTIRLD